MNRKTLLELLMGDSQPLPQLDAPVISLSGYILSIEEVENAEYYDIYVDGVLEESVPAVNLISFTIENNTYQAESGMTWNEFINSNYNTSNIYYDSSSGYIVIGNEGFGTFETGSPAIENSDYDFVTLSDTIIENENYITTHYVPSGGSND